jgi:putative transcriptional regulator
MSKTDTSKKIRAEDARPFAPMRPMSEAEIDAAAAADPDAQPMSEAEFRSARRVPRVKTLRRALRLTQEEFAARFRIPLGTLRDWEQERSEPDQPAKAYLRAIAGDAAAVHQALNSGFSSQLKTMTSDRKTLKITKVEGATRQTVSAIEAFIRGDLDIAITLAGAAEGMLSRQGNYLFSYLRDSPRAQDVEKKEWVRALNEERDWLKHADPDHATVLELEREHAAIMIARAASKLEKWPPQIEEFKEWLCENIEIL